MADSPCDVWFYHLERASLDQVLPELLEKTLARDWRALVRSTARERVEHLDGWLWSYRDDAFLPHGAEPGDISPFRRCILVFDGRDEGALAAARGRWSAFKRDGREVSYWRQGEQGGWRKEA